MKARLPKGYGRPDPNAMMRQVQKMQDEIRAKQEELEAKENTGTASGEDGHRYHDRQARDHRCQDQARGR